MTSVNSLPNVRTQFDAAAEPLGLDDGHRRRLVACVRSLIVSVATMHG